MNSFLWGIHGFTKTDMSGERMCPFWKPLKRCFSDYYLIGNASIHQSKQRRTGGMISIANGNSLSKKGTCVLFQK